MHWKIDNPWICFSEGLKMAQERSKHVALTIYYFSSSSSVIYFLVYLLQLLYTFRVAMCPSSGELTVSLRRLYFSLCMDVLTSTPDSHPSSSSSSSVICQTTGPKPLPKWFLHTVRSRASSFKWQYPLLSLRSSSSFLRLWYLCFWKEATQDKLECGIFFHLVSTSQYNSRSNHSGHACCYTNLNHLENHLLCASSRYWWRCFRHQFWYLSLSDAYPLTCPATEVLPVATLPLV